MILPRVRGSHQPHSMLSKYFKRFGGFALYDAHGSVPGDAKKKFFEHRSITRNGRRNFRAVLVEQ